MYYFEVWVNSLAYHSKSNLTYHFNKKLSKGAIIEVNLKNKTCLAFVVKQVAKPNFITKPINHQFSLPALPTHLILLSQWLISYYPSNIGTIAKLILPISLTKLPENNFNDLSQKTIIRKNKLPPLTSEQQKALSIIKHTNTYLLHGITGSGKTRIYIELIKQELQKNKSVIILIPEISLLTQLVQTLSKNFNNVLVWHSQQTQKARLKNWLEILQSPQPKIIVGPRSAIFSPIKKLGLIIIDEAHETAYKQEQAPRYETTRVAAYLSRLTGSKLILGSATPSVNDYYLAKQKNKPIIELNHKVYESKKFKHQITIIDLKDRTNFTKSNFLSRALIRSIQQSLDDHQQVLLYLNRRGTARLIFCQQCGWQANCPHCDTTLTYHHDDFILKCHSCDYQQKPPLECPNCHYQNIIFKTIGTKAVVTEIEKLFPTARLARFDNDNHKSERLENNYEKIIEKQIDILIGTQIVAKGLDILKLSTLGIIMADTSLFLPDFSSQERTFQLINQVIGRVDRGHLNSRTIIQTYQPDHPTIQQAIHNDYQAMYETEITNRQKYFFPPICSILKVTIKKNNRQKTIQDAKYLKNSLLKLKLPVIIEGPTPAYQEKIKNFFYWQLIIKAKNRHHLLTIINHLPPNCYYDIDPINLL